jgi:hypothetical protein
VVEHVDQFFHVKEGGIFPLSPKRMQELTRLKKIHFLCPANAELPSSIKETRDHEEVEVVSQDADQYLRDLVHQNIPFSQLRIEKLGVDELLRMDQ